MSYVIRPCEQKDMAELVGLCQAHAIYEKASYIKEEKQARLESVMFTDKPSLHCLVVEFGHTLIGYSSYTFNYSTWEVGYFLYLDCLYIKSAYRGHQIGEEMMKRLIAIARQRGCINLQWQTPIF